MGVLDACGCTEGAVTKQSTPTVAANRPVLQQQQHRTCEQCVTRREYTIVMEVTASFEPQGCGQPSWCLPSSPQKMAST